MKTLNIIEILERTQTGEYCTVKEWDTRRVPRTIREKLKKFLEIPFKFENLGSQIIFYQPNSGKVN